MKAYFFSFLLISFSTIGIPLAKAKNSNEVAITNSTQFVFKRWTYGGEPGSNSILLTIEKNASGTTAQLTESGMNFESESAQPFKRSYKWDLDTREASEIITPLKTSPLIQNGKQRNEKKDVADLRHEQWSLKFAEKSDHQSFSEPFPTSFEKLRKACEQLVIKMKGAPIGSATMETDGTIVMTLNAKGPEGLQGQSQLRYPKNDRKYEETLRHLKGLKPGETKTVPPWPDQ